MFAKEKRKNLTREEVESLIASRKEAQEYQQNRRYIILVNRVINKIYQGKFEVDNQGRLNVHIRFGSIGWDIDVYKLLAYEFKLRRYNLDDINLHVALFGIGNIYTLELIK